HLWQGKNHKGCKPIGKIIGSNNDNRVIANEKSLIMVYLLEFTPFVALFLYLYSCYLNSSTS
ncbi:hypothetical protein KKG56_02065, partial [bacterium]|nr:hypothetical protein [bacterium]